MLPGNTNIKAYLIAAVSVAFLLLLLVVKLRPDKQREIYHFSPWVDINAFSNENTTGSYHISQSVSGELKRIKISRPMEISISDSNEFKVKKVKTTRFHIVRESDTLSEISAKYYGTSRRWREIFQANKDVIGDPDFLKKGTKLIIPK